MPQGDNPGVVLEISKPVHTAFPGYQEELSSPQTSLSTPGSRRAKRGTRRDVGCWPPSLCPFRFPFGGLPVYCQTLPGRMAWLPTTSPSLIPRPSLQSSEHLWWTHYCPEQARVGSAASELPSYTVSSILSCCFGQMHWFPINKTKRKENNEAKVTNDLITFNNTRSVMWVMG